MKKSICLIVIFLQSFIYAQTQIADLQQRRCYSDELYLKYLKSDQLKVKEQNLINEKWVAFSKANSLNTLLKRGAANYEICVVFHKMNNSNINYTLAKSVVDKLNSNFSNNNIKIHFNLAQTDINRVDLKNTVLNYSVPNSKLNPDDSKQIESWAKVVQDQKRFPWNKYLNIYVAEEISYPTLAFAYMPTFFTNQSYGVYVMDDYLQTGGNVNSSVFEKNMVVLTHEVGHALGLFHTFGLCTNNVSPNQYSDGCGCVNDNCLSDGDQVCDTPPTKEVFNIEPCVNNSKPINQQQNSCKTDLDSKQWDENILTSDMPDMLSNYMHYNKTDAGNVNCVNKFTPGQIKRMYFYLDTINGVLKSLVQKNSCNSLCATGCDIKIIKPYTVISTGDTLKNTILLNKTASGIFNQYPFSATVCDSLTGGIYKNFKWRVIDLSTNMVLDSSINKTYSFKFTQPGNYKIELTGSVKKGLEFCSQTTSIEIQVLNPTTCSATVTNPVCCPDDLSMSNGWLGVNWDRVKYVNGWARNNDGTFLGTMSKISKTTATDPYFDLITSKTNLNKDFNYPTSDLPKGVSKVFRVGQIINNTNEIDPGSASYVTYKFIPKKENAKIRVHYMGVKEFDPLKINNSGQFQNNIQQGNGFGVVCNYKFTSVTSGKKVERGNTHDRKTGNFYRLNDTILSGQLTGNNISDFALTDGRKVQKMKNWEYVDLDFSDFICSGDTITMTFFARSNNAANLGFLYAYSYFGVQCIPSNFKNINLNLENQTAGCIGVPGAEDPDGKPNDERYQQSCNLVNLPSFYHDETYDDLLQVVIEQSYDKKNWTPYTTQSDDKATICASTKELLDPTNPYKFFRFTYKTLCQTKKQDISFVYAFSHKIVPCRGKKLHGGHFVDDSTKTIKYVQFCDSTQLNLTAPCWTTTKDTNQYYLWQIYNGKKFVDYTSASKKQTLTLTYNNIKQINQKCVKFRRLALIYDEYCRYPIGVESDTFIVSCLKVLPLKHTTLGPNVCAKSKTNISIRNLVEQDIECDPFFTDYFKKNPKTNELTLQLFEDVKCTKPIYQMDTVTGVVTNNFCLMKIKYLNGISNVASNYLNGPINTNSTNFTFVNNLYTQGNIYLRIYNDRVINGCIADTTILPIWVPVKASSIPGQLTAYRTCGNESNIVIKGTNEMGSIVNNFYDWYYFDLTTKTWKIIDKKFQITSPDTNKNNHTLVMKYSDFNTFYNVTNRNDTTLSFKRLAPSTLDCPARFFSNTIKLKPMQFGKIDAFKDSLYCKNSLVELNGKRVDNNVPSKYFYSENSKLTFPLKKSDKITLFDQPITDGNQKDKSMSAIVDKKVYVFAQYQDSGCYSNIDSISIKIKKITITPTSSNFCKGTEIKATVTSTNSSIPTANKYTWTISPTQNGSIKYLTTNQNSISAVLQPTKTTLTASVIDKDGCKIFENIGFTPFDTSNILNLSSSIGKVYKNNKVYTVTICAPNTSVTLTPMMNTNNANFTYSWDGKAASTTANFTISYLSATNNKHNLVITNRSGCKDTINVLLVQESLPIISISGDTSICKRGTSILTASTNVLGATLNWDFNNPNPITVSKTGLNTVTATSSNGCVNKKSVNVVFKSISIKLSKKDICPNDTFTVNLGLNNIKVMYLPLKESFANKFTSNTYSNKQIVSTVSIPKYHFQPVEVINKVTNLLMKDSVVISYNVTDESGCQVDTIFTVKPYKIGLNLISTTPYYDSSDVRVFVPCKSTDDVTISPQGITNIKLGTPLGKYYTWKKDNLIILPSASPILVKSKDKLVLKQMYNCNFNDGVCSSSKSCMIRVVPDYKVTISGDTLLCKNSSNTLTCVIKDLKNATLNPNSADTSIFTYAWYNSTNKVVSRFSTLNVTTPGIYTLKVKRFNGCEQTLSYKVKLKQVGFKITQNQSLCKNQLFCIDILKNGLVTRVDKPSSTDPWIDPWKLNEYYNTSSVTTYPIDPLSNIDDNPIGTFRGTSPWEINSICSIMRDSIDIRYTMTDVQNCQIDTTFRFKSSLKLDVTSAPNLLGIRTGLYGDTVTFKTCSPITKLNLIGKNGKSAYTYNWYLNSTPTKVTSSDVINTPLFTPLFYYATVTDANKCKDTLKIKIIKPGVKVEIIGDTTTCSSSLITFKTNVINSPLSDTTKYVYTLTNTTLGQKIILPVNKSVSLTPGNYKLVVKGGGLICGDSIIKLFKIYPKNIKLTLSPITDNLQDICYGGNLNYTINSSEPIEDKDLKINYSNSFDCLRLIEKESSVIDNFSPSLKRSPSTLHNLSLKNIRLGNNCSCSYIGTINITNSCSTDKISIAFSQKNARILPLPKNQYLSCQNDSVQLTISTCGQIPKIYQWQDSLTNKVLSNSKVYYARPGVYKYSVINECGIVEDSSYVRVSEKSSINYSVSGLDLTNVNYMCKDQIIKIKVCADPNIDLSNQVFSLTNTTLCRNIDPYQTSILPVSFTKTVDPTNKNCAEISFKSLMYECDGFYTLSGPCIETKIIKWSTRLPFRVFIRQEDLCKSVLPTTITPQVSNGSTITNYPFDYSWSPSNPEVKTNSFTITQPGNYTLTVKDKCGNPSSTTINVSSGTDISFVDIPGVTTQLELISPNNYQSKVCRGSDLVFQICSSDLKFNLEKYLKSKYSTLCESPDGIISRVKNETQNCITYKVLVSESPGCSSGYNFFGSCINNSLSLGIGFTTCGLYELKESKTTSKNIDYSVSIYPNPSNGDFEIVTNHEAIENYKIIIYDLAGKEIYTKNMIDQASGVVATQINLSNNKLANGLYSVKIYINDEVINQKIQINN